MNNDAWVKLTDQGEDQQKGCLQPNRKTKLLIIIFSIIGVIAIAALAVCLVFLLKKDKNAIIINSLNITLIGETYPDGQRITCAAIDFITDDNKENYIIDNSKLDQNSFSIPERNITSIHSSSSLTNPHKVENGRYVIIELNPKDPDAPIIYNMNQIKFQGRKNVTLHVQQKSDIELTNGNHLKKSSKVFTNEPDINKAISLIVDDFKTDIYLKDDDHNQNLSYNIYVPKSLKKSNSNDEKYPLILFMHDASIMCNDTRMTLFQGVGATVWATEEEQNKHESFVVAPCFTETIVNDSYKYTNQYLHIIPMLNDLINNKFKGKIDTNRLYTTGQSMGCMASISLMCEYPNFFASGMYVAGQWDEKIMEALLNQTFWILCSETDMKSPAQNDKAMENLEKLGAKISRARWYGNATETEKKENVKNILAEGNNKMYVKFVNHTVMPDDIPYKPTDEHMYTWKVAYLIEGVRDWLFNQHLN